MVCSIESCSPQYRHSLSPLIPNLQSSFLVTTILWRNLKWNSLSLNPLETCLMDVKNFSHCFAHIGIDLPHLVGPACGALVTRLFKNQSREIFYLLPGPHMIPNSPSTAFALLGSFAGPYNSLAEWGEEAESVTPWFNTVEPRLRPRLLRDQFPKYQKFPSQITVFGTFCKRPSLLSDRDRF